MKYKLLNIWLLLPLLLIIGCYGINSKTSEIGDINSICQSKNAWEEILKENSVDRIKDSTFIEGLKYVKNHFSNPKYILYFQDEPKEIIGCDWYTVRVAFNPKIFDGDIDGLSPALSDREQARIRNRVLKLLYKYECPEGKKQLLKELKKPAVFSDEYYDNQ